MANLGSDVNHYYSTMSGAPALNHAAGSIIGVLKACLVDGFGGEAAQGAWEVAYEVTNKAVFKSNASDTARYLRVDDTTELYATVSIYEEMTSVDSGTNHTGTLYWIKSSNTTGSRKWRLFADSCSFHLFTYWYGTGSSAADGWFFGEVDRYKETDSYTSYIIGATTSSLAYTGGNSGDVSNYWKLGADNLQTHRVIRNYNGSVGYKPTFKCAHYLNNYGDNPIIGGGTGQIIYYPDVVGGRFLCSPVEVGQFIDDGGAVPNSRMVRGRLPGLYAPLHVRALSDGATVIAYHPDGQLIGEAFLVKVAFAWESNGEAYSGRAAIDLTGPWSNWGTLSISGIVTEVAVPGSYRVCLFRQSDMQLVNTVWSGNDGSYSFTGLSQQNYVVAAFDHTDPLRSPAIQDNVVPS